MAIAAESRAARATDARGVSDRSIQPTVSGPCAGSGGVLPTAIP